MELTKSKKTASRIIDGFVYIVIPEKDTLCKLDEVGSFIWRFLDGEKGENFDDIVTGVYKEFDVDYETAKKDVSHFVDILLAKNIVERL